VLFKYILIFLGAVRVQSSGRPDYPADVQWGANSLVISASDVDEGVRESLIKGADVFELPVLRIHWLKIRDRAS
jgi:hypothetical protein